ncbi:hypothetical protein AEI14_00565 [Campylobacter jejuni]|nr:hypothetical protein AEI14_00565 [Campylobacter jejuni]
MNSIKIKLSLIANLIAIFALIVLGIVSFYFTKTSLYESITQINDSVAQIDQTTKDNVEIANESAIISSTVSDIANNILEDIKKKRF